MTPLQLFEFKMIMLHVVVAVFVAVSATLCAMKKKPMTDRGKSPSPGTTKKSPSPSAADDTFEHHMPVKREARRADEIRKKKAVSGARDDYKTFNKNTMPESDFDNSFSQH